MSCPAATARGRAQKAAGRTGGKEGPGSAAEEVREVTYTNPVYPEYFADPFAWKFNGTYYAIGTGADEAGGRVHENVFPLLTSPDLVHWDGAGRALERLPRVAQHEQLDQPDTRHDRDGEDEE